MRKSAIHRTSSAPPPQVSEGAEAGGVGHTIGEDVLPDRLRPMPRSFGTWTAGGRLSDGAQGRGTSWRNPAVARWGDFMPRLRMNVTAGSEDLHAHYGQIRPTRLTGPVGVEDYPTDVSPAGGVAFRGDGHHVWHTPSGRDRSRPEISTGKAWDRWL